MIASAAVHDGTASLHVGAQTGSPMLVKIGKQTIKILWGTIAAESSDSDGEETQWDTMMCENTDSIIQPRITLMLRIKQFFFQHIFMWLPIRIIGENRG